jgi:repressor LexA
MIEKKSMLPRTQRQKDILDFITRFLERHGHQPSYAQIARHFGVKSRATIAKHITALEKRGLLARQHEDGSFGLNVKVEDNTSDSLCEGETTRTNRSWCAVGSSRV